MPYGQYFSKMRINNAISRTAKSKVGTFELILMIQSNPHGCSMKM